MKKASMIIVLFVSFLGISYDLLAQNNDKIYLKSKEVIEGKVLKVDGENIEVDPIGEKPFIIIKRSDAEVIIYSDNTVVNMGTSSTPTNSESIELPSFSDKQYFSVVSTVDAISVKPYSIDQRFDFYDDVNNRDVILTITGEFKYLSQKYSYMNKWRFEMKYLQMEATLDVGNNHFSAPLIRVQDEKKHRHSVTGSVAGSIGSYNLEVINGIELGDYILDLEFSKVGPGDLVFIVGLNPK